MSFQELKRLVTEGQVVLLALFMIFVGGAIWMRIRENSVRVRQSRQLQLEIGQQEGPATQAAAQAAVAQPDIAGAKAARGPVKTDSSQQRKTAAMI